MSRFSTLAVRILGLLWITLGLWQALGNLIDGYREFDPTYLGHFFSSQLLRPVLAILLGLLLWLCSRPLGRRLGRGLEEGDQGRR